VLLKNISNYFTLISVKCLSFFFLHFCLSVNDLFLTLDKTIVKYYIGYVSLICRFIATQNYKSSGTAPQKQVGIPAHTVTEQLSLVAGLIPGF
jgi:hypothetical protein